MKTSEHGWFEVSTGLCDRQWVDSRGAAARVPVGHGTLEALALRRSGSAPEGGSGNAVECSRHLDPVALAHPRVDRHGDHVARSRLSHGTGCVPRAEIRRLEVQGQRVIDACPDSPLVQLHADFVSGPTGGHSQGVLVIHMPAAGRDAGPAVPLRHVGVVVSRQLSPPLGDLGQSADLYQPDGGLDLCHPEVVADAVMDVGLVGVRLVTKARAGRPSTVAPTAWHASWIRLSPCSCVRPAKDSTSPGLPCRWTSTIAFVRGPMSRSAAEQSRFRVSSTSAKTGTAPVWAIALAVAMKVSGLVMTSSPGPIPWASRARYRATDPLQVATPCLAPINVANCCSKARVRSPCVSTPERITSRTAHSSSGPS